MSGSAAAGVVHAALPADAPATAVAQFVTGLRDALGSDSEVEAAVRSATGPRGSVVVLHAPPAVRDTVDLWGPVAAVALMRAIKDQFDPDHRMAPGRFAGGI